MLNKRQRSPRWGWLLAAVLLVLGFGTAAAAELVAQDIYRIPAGTTVADDLYVTGTEVYINGTVDGDLVVMASYVEINGTVTGDVLLLAAGTQISGTIGDDLRAMAGGLVLAGTVGGDTAVFAGGGSTLAMPLNLGGQNVPQGLVMRPTAQVGGDVLLSAGTADLWGAIDQDVRGSATVLNLAGSIGGDVDVDTTLLTVADTAAITGQLIYRAPQTGTIAQGTAAAVNFTNTTTEIGAGEAIAQVLLRLVSLMAGFSLLGWLILHYAPYALYQPVQTLAYHPTTSMWLGFLVALLFLFFPIATAFLALGVGVFWGLWAAVVLALFCVTGLVLVWIFSPMVVALWIGLRFNQQPLTALLLGLLILVPLTQFPLLGGFVSAACFFLTVGSLLLSRRSE